jgi:hypothetical protein
VSLKSKIKSARPQDPNDNVAVIFNFFFEIFGPVPVFINDSKKAPPGYRLSSSKYKPIAKQFLSNKFTVFGF